MLAVLVTCAVSQSTFLLPNYKHTWPTFPLPVPRPTYAWLSKPKAAEPAFVPPKPPANEVGFALYLGTRKPSATQDQIAAVQKGMPGDKVAETLGENLTCATYRIRNYRKTTYLHFPSLDVTVGPDGKVTDIEVPRKED